MPISPPRARVRAELLQEGELFFFDENEVGYLTRYGNSLMRVIWKHPKSTSLQVVVHHPGVRWHKITAWSLLNELDTNESGWVDGITWTNPFNRSDALLTEEIDS
jgi:hypothetical protein